MQDDVQKSKYQDDWREIEYPQLDKAFQVVEYGPLPDYGRSEGLLQALGIISVFFPPKIVEALSHPFAHKTFVERAFQGMIHRNSEYQGKSQVYHEKEKNHPSECACFFEPFEKIYKYFHVFPPAQRFILRIR